MSPPRRLQSSGDAGIGVMRDPRRDRHMVAVLTITTVDDTRWQVELTLDDVRSLRADLVELLGADADQVAQWWRFLADGADGRPRAASRHNHDGGVAMSDGARPKTLPAQQNPTNDS